MIFTWVSPGARPTMSCSVAGFRRIDRAKSSRQGWVVVRLVQLVMVVIVVLVFIVWIVWSTDNSVLVFGRPRIHVDIESGRRHFVAHRVFNLHRESVGILKRRLRIGGDMHDGDQ